MTTFKKGQRKIKNPCAGCGLNLLLCLCESIPLVQLKTRITLIIHAKEFGKMTNTGRLAQRALANSQILVRGRPDSVLDLTSHLPKEYETVLLFPAADAEPLSDEWLKRQARAVHLIVPDGNWRQAQKVMLRQRELHGVKKVFIAKPNAAREHLRKETSPYGRSTLEAIAEAVSVLEGAEAAKPLFDLYRLKLERTLQGRSGRLSENVDLE